jgi:hypothetical protein
VDDIFGKRKPPSTGIARPLGAPDAAKIGSSLPNNDFATAGSRYACSGPELATSGDPPDRTVNAGDAFQHRENVAWVHVQTIEFGADQRPADPGAAQQLQRAIGQFARAADGAIRGTALPFQLQLPRRRQPSGRAGGRRADRPRPARRRPRNDLLAARAEQLRQPTIATNTVHYAQTAARAGSRPRWPQYGPAQSGRDGRLAATALGVSAVSREMAARMRRWPSAVARAALLGAQCGFDLQLVAPRLPPFDTPPGRTESAYLRALTLAGADRHYGDPAAEPEAYRQIEHDLAVITELGFLRYFLMVWDIIRFCAEKDILCQDRGSAANSVVCYALGITLADPIAYNLLVRTFPNGTTRTNGLRRYCPLRISRRTHRRPPIRDMARKLLPTPQRRRTEPDHRSFTAQIRLRHSYSPDPQHPGQPRRRPPQRRDLRRPPHSTVARRSPQHPRNGPTHSFLTRRVIRCVLETPVRLVRR